MATTDVTETLAMETPAMVTLLELDMAISMVSLVETHSILMETIDTTVVDPKLTQSREAITTTTTGSTDRCA